MNYALIRDTIYTNVVAVSGIGKVFRHIRYSSEWDKFLSLFTTVNPADATKKLINVTTITRINAPESRDTGTGSVDEADDLVAIERRETWEIRIWYGFDDDDDYTKASETGFHVLLDNMQQRFRFLDQLGIPATIERSYPLSLQDAGLRMFSDVLCHAAVFHLILIQRIVVP